MKRLFTGLYSKMSGSNFETLIGGRLFKGYAPAEAEYPYCVMSLVTGDPWWTFEETFEDVLIQFSLYSSSLNTDEIDDIYAALRTLYDDCTLTVSGHTVLWCQAESYSGPFPEERTTLTGTEMTWHYPVGYRILLKVN